MDFTALLQILHADLVRRRDNGEFTERGLASLTGLSQPHIHHILRGARHLTPSVADQVLRVLDLSLAELISSSNGKSPS